MFCVIKSTGIFRSLSLQIPDFFICSLDISTGMSKTHLSSLSPQTFLLSPLRRIPSTIPGQAQKSEVTPWFPPLSHAPGLIHYQILLSHPSPQSLKCILISVQFFKDFLTIFQVFIQFVTISFLFYGFWFVCFFAVGLWGPRSQPTKDGALCNMKVKSS